MITNRKSTMTFRLYEPRDHEAVVEIFKKQNIQPPVNLPMPEKDPATAFVIVGEENGAVKRALLLRAALEAHYVTDGSEVQGDDLRRMTEIAEGIALQMNFGIADLNKMWKEQGLRTRLPLFTDVFARVPRAMPKMVEFMKKKLRFIEEMPEFLSLWKLVGR